MHRCAHVSVCGGVCHCRALQHVVEKCGSAFEPHLTSDLLQLVFTCLSHANRLVETVFIESVLVDHCRGKVCLLVETVFIESVLVDHCRGKVCLLVETVFIKSFCLLVETVFIKSFCLLVETGFYQVIVSTVEGRGRLSLHGICRSMV